MTVKLSTKGQLVLPKQARTRLQLRAGCKLVCRIEGGSVVLTPEQPASERPKLVRDPKTGLIITKSPPHVQVSSGDVKSALADFP